MEQQNNFGADQFQEEQQNQISQNQPKNLLFTILQNHLICLYCSILDNLKGIQLDVDFPELIVIGPQSSGKSTLIEYFIKIPFLLKKCINLASRHITEFRLTKSNPGKIKIYKGLQNKSTDQLYDISDYKQWGKVYTDLDNTAGQNQISDETIYIEIGGFPFNITITDVPGLSNDPQHKEITRKLLDQQLIKKQAIFLYTLQSSSDISSDIGFNDYIMKNEDIQKRTFMVITKTDLNDTNVRMANDWFSQRHTRFRNLLGILCMKPITLDHGSAKIEEIYKMENDEKIKFLESNEAEKIQYFENQEKIEKDFFDLKLQQGLIDQQYEQFLGREKCFNICYVALFQNVKTQINQTSQKIDAKLKTNLSQIKTNEQILNYFKLNEDQDLENNQIQTKEIIQDKIIELQEIFNTFIKHFYAYDYKKLLSSLEEQYVSIYQFLLTVLDYETLFALIKQENNQISTFDFGIVIDNIYNQLQPIYKEITEKKIKDLRYMLLKQLQNKVFDKWSQKFSLNTKILKRKFSNTLQELVDQFIEQHANYTFIAYSKHYSIKSFKKGFIQSNQFNAKQNIYNVHQNKRREYQNIKPQDLEYDIEYYKKNNSQNKSDFIQQLIRYKEKQQFDSDYPQFRNPIIESVEYLRQMVIEHENENLDKNQQKRYYKGEYSYMNTQIFLQSEIRFNQYVQHIDKILFDGQEIVGKIYQIYFDCQQYNKELINEQEVLDQKEQIQIDMNMLFLQLNEFQKGLFSEFQSKFRGIFMGQVEQNFIMYVKDSINKMTEDEINEMVSEVNQLKITNETLKTQNSTCQVLLDQLQVLDEKLN